MASKGLTVKTTNSTRPQYSVEAIDPDKLALLRHRLQRPGSGGPACTGILSKCPRGMNSTEILASPEKFTLFPLLPPELRIKIWKLAIRPRIVMKQVYYKGSPKPIFTPGVPVLMHTSVEARKIALENYSTSKEHRISYGCSRVESVEGPITFNFELDTFLSLMWDGRAAHTYHPFWLPSRITSKLRHLCISISEFDCIIFSKRDPCPLAEKVEAAYDLFKRFDKLEDVSVYGETRGSLRADRPWEAHLVDDMPERVFDTFPSTYNGIILDIG